MGMKEDVSRLVQTHKTLISILSRPDPTIGQKILSPLAPTPGRQAAELLCKELEWLTKTNDPFWTNLSAASSRLQAHERSAKSAFRTIDDLIKAEAEIFHRLGIDADSTATVLSHAYASLRILKQLPAPTTETVGNLRDRLRMLTDKVCQASKGPLERAFGKLVSLKGAGIVGGAAVAGADVAIAVADQGTLSWISLKAGYHLMRGQYDELWKILTGEDPPDGGMWT